MIHILLGAAVIAAGAVIVIKAESFYNAFGSIAFFDRHFHTEGGGRLGYKLLGMMIAFFGVLIMTNLFGGFIMWILGPFIRMMYPEAGF